MLGNLPLTLGEGRGEDLAARPNHLLLSSLIRVGELGVM